MEAKLKEFVNISIIIPVKNGMPILGEVLDQLFKQDTKNLTYNVLIVDSGSNDTSIDHITELQRHHKNLFIISIKPEDFGHGKTRNFGIEQTNSEFCVMITQDAKPANDQWLINLIQPMLDDREVAGVFGRHIAYDHADIYTKYALEGHFHNLSHFPKVSKYENEERYNDKEDLPWRQMLHFFSDNSSALRRSVWEKHPYQDVDFAEDQIWAREIIEQGYKKAYAHESIVYHSHDYNSFESFRRSFDEAKAFRQYFNYRLFPKFFALFPSMIKMTKHDWRRAKSENLWKSHFFFCLRRPAQNFARIFGHFLGTHHKKLSQAITNFISLDKNFHNRKK